MNRQLAITLMAISSVSIYTNYSREHGAVLKLDSMSEWDAALKESKPKLVDIRTTWCGPCKSLEKPFSEVAEEFHNKMLFIEVDGEKFPNIENKYNVQAYPTLIYLDKNNKVIHTMRGGANKEILRHEVENILAGKVPVKPKAEPTKKKPTKKQTQQPRKKQMRKKVSQQPEINPM